MVVRLVMMVLGWSLGCGSTPPDLYHYVKVIPPTAATWKTVSTATYAVSDPNMYVDPVANIAYVAWIHRSSAGRSVKARLAVVSADSVVTQVTLDTRTVVDRQPVFERDSYAERVCFNTSPTTDACWIHRFGTAATLWEFEETRDPMPPPTKRLYFLPLIQK
jgi:hypothetical protein